jgi:Spy/CpxP family protein refolding chaperone
MTAADNEADALRQRVAELEGRLREARTRTLLEVADFCTQAATYRERIAAETFDSAALEHRIAATELKAIRSAVLATLPQAEAGKEAGGG